MSGTPEERKDAIGQLYTRDVLSVLHRFDHCICTVCGDRDHAQHTTCVVCDACCCRDHVQSDPDTWAECETCHDAVYACTCKTTPQQGCTNCPATWCIGCGVERSHCDRPDCVGSVYSFFGPGCPNCDDAHCAECGISVCMGCANVCEACGKWVCIECFPAQACEPQRFERPEHVLSVCFQCLKTSPTPPRWQLTLFVAGHCATHLRDLDTSLETCETDMEERDGDNEDGGDKEE